MAAMSTKYCSRHPDYLYAETQSSRTLTMSMTHKKNQVQRNQPHVFMIAGTSVNL